MSAATVKLQKKATEFEQKKQYQKALDTYVQLIESSRGTEVEKDASLFNRVGDLNLRLGNVGDAVNYYERAVDLYTDAGFQNNAIALCNKILRQSPNRNAIYYKLGKISATKGFNSDAKKNFLEYADRMQRLGNMDEAFRALEEFADLCPGQDDIRLMLAEQLSRANRKDEALEQLQLLYQTFESEGRRGEAAATLERMRALDPDIKLRTTRAPREQKSDGLVFLDVSFGDDDPVRADKIEGLQPTSLDSISSLDVLPEAAEPEPPPRAQESAVSGLSSVLPDIEGAVFEPGAETRIPFEKSKTDLESSGVDLRLLIDDEELLPPVRSEANVDLEPEAEFVDLGDWLRDDEDVKSSRMVARDDKRVGDEQAEFGDMLAKFKQGVAANIEAEDFDSHYDLGVAYREMGLIDEAIAEFQKAVKGHTQRVRAYEAIGQAFIEKQQHAVAHSVLLRALKDPEVAPETGGEVTIMGIHYLLGLACENLQRYSEASSYYQKVLAEDIGFRDVLARLNAVTEMAR